MRRSALVFLGCAFGLLVVAIPSIRAASPTLQALADAKALPLSHSFKKVEGGEKGPFVITLKNDSDAAVKVTPKILLAVVMHAESKARHLPAHTIEAGQSWSIADLAAEDKVILTADGFAPMEIVVK